MQQLQNYIGSEFMPAVEGKYLPVENPATAELIAEVPLSDEQDLNLAIQAARSAYVDWSRTSTQHRAVLLNKIADLIEDNQNELALLESQDTGKPLSLSKKVDIPRAVENFRFFANAITQTGSEMHDMGQDGFNYTRREPLGVVACISPWNLPLYLLTWKIAPALAAGNCVIAKPSEVTPITASILAKIIHQAGVPSGVFSLLHGQGQGIGEKLCQHAEIAAISFTGSTQTGQLIAQSTAKQFKKTSLEMGGKNPAIIFADCDLDKTVDGIVRASFTNQGQVCLCSSRILVESSIYEEFKSRFVEKTKSLKVGDPLEAQTQQGAITSNAQQEKVLSFIELAQDEGGALLCGGKTAEVPGLCAKGHFILPTIIEGLDNQSKVNQQEIFGPVVTLQSFTSIEEAISLANAVPYGLSATVWTSNLDKAQQCVNECQVGMVWVNNWLKRDLRVPFGGYKQSGLGREGGKDALHFFTQSKNVYINFKG